MKRVLLLSLLVIFSCSKDSMESTDSGNKIIGNYQLVLKTSDEQAEYSFWEAITLTNVTAHTDLSGKLSFTSDLKGYYDILVNNENIKVNFDWSYQGGNWYVIDENSLQWVIKDTDRCVSETIYCTGQPNTSSLYIMEKKAGYRTRDWRFSRLVF
ncbi:hypothetical protein N9D33_05555 [Flavobacteriaceae bacterium]|nr:hypothetical protein [Flavobacteriaceae bacterium]